MNQGYFTVSEQQENVIVIERSKFICNIKGVKDEDDAKDFIDSIRKKYSLANHNCYAYIADDKGLVQKFSDDGEPQGTAGLPMLEVLKNKRMYKTVAVVTRFFGGIKLGTGGLTRAYGGSVSEVLGKSKISDMQPAILFRLTLEYDLYSHLLKYLTKHNVAIIDTQFENSVTVNFAIKKDQETSFLKGVADTFNGKLCAEKITEQFFAF